ncbi:hypothetical protein BGX33_004097 [Mortierella sp. NVP41]|nr:hypothetical protein BGX33_004097 [Mortierella sp. NVP41]
MPEPTIPKSAPIKTFKDLLDWKPGQDEYNVAHTPFHPRPAPLSRQRGFSTSASSEFKGSASAPGLNQTGLKDCKVIVCHDMAGGYAEDASPQGNDYCRIYSIQYWNHVDIFIYFSHYRITIPPPVWTNAAHRNGVRSLGTIITEWLPGVLETDEMVSGPGQALADEDGNDTVDRRWFSRTYADKLVDLAVYYKFDGWFINIESIMRGGVQQVNQTIAFLSYFREQIRQRIPGGELHWYDSVITSTGEIAWQDKLSLENYRFFEQSDGIFTNYTWKEHAVGESVALAGPRNRDVYTGIDIWGRNTFGGGGFTTFKALEIIQRERSSCALFAPAWTYESLGKDGFMTNDRLFWAGYNGAGFHAENLPLSSFYWRTCHMLAIKPPKKKKKEEEDKEDGKELSKDKDGDKEEEDNRNFLPVAAYIPMRPSGCSSWFYSNFDRGFGKGFWINGKKVSDKPWSHLSHQSLPPSMAKEVFSIERGHNVLPLPGKLRAVRWVLSPDDAYNGGTSLVVQEFSLDSSTPPLPPLPIPSTPTPTPSPPSSPPTLPPGEGGDHKDAAIDTAHTTRTRSIIVPLFDTQISLMGAQSSTVELVFKTCQSDVQVGVHLGMLAAEQELDGDGKALTVARKFERHELLELLEPSVKAQWESVPLLGQASSPDSVPSSSKGFLSVGAIEGADQSRQLETVLALDVSPQEGGYVDAIEILEGGWRRLTLHISSLFSALGEKRSDLSTIFLSQLGLTLTYESQAAPSKAPEKEESRPLVIVGSLAVVPTWSAVYKGSCVQGLKADANQFVVEETKPDPTIGSVARHRRHQQQHALSDIATIEPIVRPAKPVLKVSSTVTWNVGFPIVRPNLGTPKRSSSSGEVSSTDYSHFAVYVSLEQRDATVTSVQKTRAARGGGGSDRVKNSLLFVGTAFTNRYQIAQFEIPLDQFIPESGSGPVSRLSETATTATEAMVTTSATDVEHQPAVQRLLTSLELEDRGRQSLWVWVQGVRRDGRADERHDWAVGRLLQ